MARKKKANWVKFHSKPASSHQLLALSAGSFSANNLGMGIWPEVGGSNTSRLIFVLHGFSRHLLSVSGECVFLGFGWVLVRVRVWHSGVKNSVECARTRFVSGSDPFLRSAGDIVPLTRVATTRCHVKDDWPARQAEYLSDAQYLWWMKKPNCKSH